jgi:hypothetical protein
LVGGFVSGFAEFSAGVFDGGLGALGGFGDFVAGSLVAGALIGVIGIASGGGEDERARKPERKTSENTEWLHGVLLRLYRELFRCMFIVWALLDPIDRCLFKEKLGPGNSGPNAIRELIPDDDIKANAGVLPVDQVVVTVDSRPRGHHRHTPRAAMGRCNKPVAAVVEAAIVAT